MPMSEAIEKLVNRSLEDLGETSNIEFDIMSRQDENYSIVNLKERDLLMKNLY